MKIILHTVDIKAMPAQVFDALSTMSGLSGWWSTMVKADVRTGGIIDFTFVGTFNPKMEIIALEKPRLISWRCVGGHDPWSDNTFHFEIEARDDGSVLFFRQEYERELSNEEYGRYNFNWGYYLESLRLYIETGKGTPFRASQG